MSLSIQPTRVTLTHKPNRSIHSEQVKQSEKDIVRFGTQKRTSYSQKWGEEALFIELPKTWNTLAAAEESLNRRKMWLKQVDKHVAEFTKEFEKDDKCLTFCFSAAGFLAEIVQHTATCGLTLWHAGASTAAGTAMGKALSSGIKNLSPRGRSFLARLEEQVYLNSQITSMTQKLKTLKVESERLNEIEYKVQDILRTRSVHEIIKPYYTTSETPPSPPVQDMRAISDTEIQALISYTENSVINEHKRQASSLLKKMSSIPGFSARYEKIRDSGLAGPNIDITLGETLLSFLGKSLHDPDTQTRISSLQQFYLAEKNDHQSIKLSQGLYPKVFHHGPHPQDRAQALFVMMNEPELQPSNFEQMVISALHDPEPILKRVAMLSPILINSKAASINVALERIEARESGFDKDMRNLAEKLLQKRKEAGLYTPLIPHVMARNIVAHIVGNPGLEQQLLQALTVHKANLLNPHNTGASIKLYLPGGAWHR